MKPPSKQWPLVSIIARSPWREVGNRTRDAEQLLSRIVAVRSAATAGRTGMDTVLAEAAEAARDTEPATVRAASTSVTRRMVRVDMRTLSMYGDICGNGRIP